MIHTILFLIQFLLACIVITVQPIDVWSTNIALKRPDVVEQGDTELGLGNLAGWAMTRLGRFWWIIKLPLVLILAPLLWVDVPAPVAPALILFLFAAAAYFIRITIRNFHNAFDERKTI